MCIRLISIFTPLPRHTISSVCSCRMCLYVKSVDIVWFKCVCVCSYHIDVNARSDRKRWMWTRQLCSCFRVCMDNIRLPYSVRCDDSIRKTKCISRWKVWHVCYRLVPSAKLIIESYTNTESYSYVYICHSYNVGVERVESISVQIWHLYAHI